jgi:choline-glycine betaine transporter
MGGSCWPPAASSSSRCGWRSASYGRIPLGRDDEAPEFRTVSWIAMMFSAGMGIGLMFYGVAEPLAHFTSPPPGTAAPGHPRGVRRRDGHDAVPLDPAPVGDLRVVGLAIAYGTFRRGRPQLLSSAFIPLFGRKRAEGRVRPRRRHPGDLRDAVRVGRLARPGRAADRRRPHPPAAS